VLLPRQTPALREFPGEFEESEGDVMEPPFVRMRMTLAL
jgi:hypothetical protein